MATKQMTKTQRAARAKGWKRKHYENFELPSGACADLQRPRLTTLIMKDGNIPNSLIGTLFDGGTQKQKQAKFDKMGDDEKVEHIKNMMYLSNQIAVAAFVSPKIVTEGEADYEADEIHLDDLGDEDKDFLSSWVMGQGSAPEEALKRFLEQRQKAGVEAA